MQIKPITTVDTNGLESCQQSLIITASGVQSDNENTMNEIIKEAISTAISNLAFNQAKLLLLENKKLLNKQGEFFTNSLTSTLKLIFTSNIIDKTTLEESKDFCLHLIHHPDTQLV